MMVYVVREVWEVIGGVCVAGMCYIYDRCWYSGCSFFIQGMKYS